MQRHLQDPRIDVAELKVHIVKKIGDERSRKYFYYLGRFLSQKLTKSEFDKSCYRLLGRENLALHNKLIRLILKTASLAKSPPPDNITGTDPVWLNGVLSKVRSGPCDRTIRDRPSPLGLSTKVKSLLHQPLRREDKNGNRIMENGDLDPFANQRSGRYADKGRVGALDGRDDGAQEEQCRLILSTSHVIAPLGISLCSAKVSGAYRTVPVSTRADFISCYDSGGLSDTEMLRKRMENIAVAHGLGGISPECSSMLNNILDAYLKKLIKSSVDLAGARSMNGTQGKQSLHIQTSIQPCDITQEQHSLSLLDFRVAMELNPHQLGQDWPLLRERISIRSFE